jgi:uncharacterized protein
MVCYSYSFRVHTVGEKMSVKASHKEELLRIIHKQLPNCKVWLFGSRATGKQGRGSDIDLALDNGTKITWSTITRMLMDIDETTIPMKVDLVDLHNVTDDFKEQVLKEGILWTN